LIVPETPEILDVQILDNFSRITQLGESLYLIGDEYCLQELFLTNSPGSPPKRAEGDISSMDGEYPRRLLRWDERPKGCVRKSPGTVDKIVWVFYA
jgi:hypothetical protein